MDSLWKVYKNKTLTDTNRLNAINIIAFSFRNNKPDTAIIFAEEELKLAQTKNQKLYQGKALNIMGIAYANKGNYPKALEYYFKTLRIYEEI